MRTSTAIFKVEAIQADTITSLKEAGGFVRHIRITDENGGECELRLFGEDINQLTIESEI